MRNLIEFLAKNGVFLVFIALEVVCFNLIIRNNQRQAEIYHRVSTSMSAGLQKRVASVSDFLDLQRVNDSLRVENAEVRQKLSNSGSTSDSRNAPKSIERYVIYPAHVIQNSINARNNYITLDQGRETGIEAGMGVVSHAGPIGIVVASTKHFSRVMSVLHNNSMISASIRTKGYFGSLVWRSNDPQRMELDAIPKHAPLSVGDTVVTSGYSNIFPPDLIIGTIDTFWLPRGSNFYRTRVLLHADLANQHTAYVIKDLARTELDTLAKLDANE